MSKLDIAEIDLVIDGTTHRLAPPTPRLALAVSRKIGGLGKAFDRAIAGDLDLYMAVLREAWAEAPAGEDALLAVVFANTPEIGVACIRYVWSLQNGGKAPPVADSPSSAEGNAKPAKAKA